jgi:prophage regulatory protein
MNLRPHFGLDRVERAAEGWALRDAKRPPDAPARDGRVTQATTEPAPCVDERGGWFPASGRGAPDRRPCCCRPWDRTATQIHPRLLRIRGLVVYTGLSRSTLYRLIRAGDFPAPIRLTRATVAWIVAEIDRWLDQRLTTGGRRTRAAAPSHLGGKPTVAPDPSSRHGAPSASRPRRGSGGA